MRSHIVWRNLLTTWRNVSKFLPDDMAQDNIFHRHHTGNFKSHKNYLKYFWNRNLHAPLAKHVTPHNIFKLHSASQLSEEINYSWTSPNVYAAADNGGSVLVTCQMMHNWWIGFNYSGMWHCVMFPDISNKCSGFIVKDWKVQQFSLELSTL